MADAPSRRGLARSAATLIVSGLLAAPSASGPILEGRAVADYRLATLALVPSYANQGYRQERDGERLRVVVDARSAPWSNARFHMPASASEPATSPVAEFARAAVAGSRTRVEAVARVLHAVTAGVRYHDVDDAPSAPEEVLRRGEAHCVGLSNLSVAALDSIGIPARIARGLLYDQDGGGAVPHRWIEVFYPDAGWVFSDPTESINFVSPRHVVMTPPADPDADYEPARAVARAPRLVDVSDALVIIDVHPQRSSPLAERRERPAQFAPAVIGHNHWPHAASLSLRGRGLTHRTVAGPGLPFSFPGLATGRYLLEGRVAGHVTRTRILVGDAQLVRVELRP